MSLEKMISFHPDVGGNVNEDLVKAARHAALCSLMCISCADACSAEQKDMRQCIRVCSDCADVCSAASRVMVRRTRQDVELLRTQMEACIGACRICAAECDKHEFNHCRLCATMCRECAEDCGKALLSLH